MRERRHAGAQGAEERHVLGRVREVVVPAQDVRDPHVRVVDADGEMVERVPIGPHQDEVVEGVGRELHAAADEVVHDDRLRRHPQPDDELLARPRAPIALVGRDFPARPRVSIRASLRLRLLALGVELLGGLERAVGPALGDEPVRGRAVEVEALRLIVRALVVLEAEPVERGKNLIGELVFRALDVGVLDAQDVGALLPTGEEQVVEGGSRAADVQEAGRRGREPDARTGRLLQGSCMLAYGASRPR